VKLCVECGTPCEGSRCDQHRRKDTRGRRRTARWDALSKRLRKLSPFCEVPGCTSTDLTVDHVIPVSEAPELEYEPLNCRVLCRHHNSARKSTCTDAERAAVHAAIKAKRERQQRYYRAQQTP